MFDFVVEIVVRTNTAEGVEGIDTRDSVDEHNDRVGLVMNIFSNLKDGDDIEAVLSGLVPALYIQRNSIRRPIREISRVVEDRSFVTTFQFKAICSGDDMLAELERGVGVDQIGSVVLT